MSWHSLWPEEFLLKDKLLSLWESPCVLFVAFPLLLLIFVLCIWFLLNWLICVLGILPWVYSVWDSLGFLDLGGYFLSHFREVFDYYLLKYFLVTFLFVFFFWHIYDWNVGVFDIVPKVSEVVLLSFDSFSLSASYISILSSTSLSLYSASLFYVSSLQSNVDLSYCIIHYSLTLLYFFWVLVTHFLKFLNPCF